METIATCIVSIVLLPLMQTAERILAKAQELFQKYGVRSVTMDEIAGQLGMSKKTIYQCFTDKNMLVDATMHKHLTDSKCRCEHDQQQADNAIHEIFLIMDMLQELLADMTPTIFYDLEKFHPATFQKLVQYRNEYLYQVIRKNLEWGINEGLYRPEIDLDLMIRIRLETMFLPFNTLLFPPNKYNLAKVEIGLLEHFLYGIATAKAHRIIQKYKLKRINHNQQ